MKLTVKNADLSRELGLIEKIVGKKPTIPVLSNVLIQASAQGGLLLSATDLEIGLIGACAADVTEAGAVTLPAKKLVEIVRAQSDDMIQLSDDTRGAVRFTSGGFTSRLQSLPAKDFPSLPSMAGDQISLPRAQMKDLIAQVRFAVSEKESKFFLRGAMLVLKENEVLLVATDTTRISLSQATRVGTAYEPVIVPTKALDELAALLAEQGSGDILFARTDRHLFFDLDGRLLITRKIEGKFPNYERIIPRDHSHHASVDRLALSTVVKRLVLIADTVLLALTSAGCLDVSSASAEVGEGIETVGVQYDGPEIKLKLNGQYMLDFLNAATSERVVLSLKDAANPAVFTDGAYLNVIMGMRV